jgi:hypothetical protein
MAGAAKVSISLGAEELSWAKRQAKSRVASLSAVVSDALRKERQAEARLKLLADLGTDDISERDRNEVRNEWHAPAKPRRAVKRAKKA